MSQVDCQTRIKLLRRCIYELVDLADNSEDLGTLEDIVLIGEEALEADDPSDPDHA